MLRQFAETVSLRCHAGISSTLEISFDETNFADYRWYHRLLQRTLNLKAAFVGAEAFLAFRLPVVGWWLLLSVGQPSNCLLLDKSQ
jgi:hypothetical protein